MPFAVLLSAALMSIFGLPSVVQAMRAEAAPMAPHERQQLRNVVQMAANYAHA
jgi:hypothetical protein